MDNLLDRLLGMLVNWGRNRVISINIRSFGSSLHLQHKNSHPFHSGVYKLCVRNLSVLHGLCDRWGQGLTKSLPIRLILIIISYYIYN